MADTADLKSASEKSVGSSPTRPTDMKLRDYQEAAVDAIFKYFENGGGNPLIGMPTGTGKSLVLSEFIRRAYLTYPNQRIIKLTHVKELIAQNHKTLLKIWPSAPAGIYSAGLGQKQTCFPITFAGIASIYKASGTFGRVDLVLIDEAHLLSTKQDTMYQQFLKELRDINPYLRVIGFTATHYRVGQGLLTEGGGVFNDLCFDLTTLESFNWLLDQGYLCPLIPKKTTNEYDLDKVRVQAGDYVQKDLEAAVDKDELTYATIQETLQLAQDRNHWLVFASGINHVLHVRDMLESCGVEATCVHSKMKDSERDKNIADFKAGKYKAMVNNGILTTGFDFPGIDLIVMLRPTQSPGLWVQMLGRGTRPVYEHGFDLDTMEGRLAAQAAGPKKNCLVLDFAGNTRRLGPINDPVIPKRKGPGGGGSAPIKICEVCGVYNHASVRFCVMCGTEFLRHVKLTQGASTDDLIKSNVPKIETFRVDKVIYHEHKKEGRPPSIRVSYYCGLRMFEEWICLEHEGFARKKARDWWRARSEPQAYLRSNPNDPKILAMVQPYLEPPATTAEGLCRLKELKAPKSIQIWINKPHPEITAYDFD
jgi:DNA repair protein RadD